MDKLRVGVVGVMGGSIGVMVMLLSLLLLSGRAMDLAPGVPGKGGGIRGEMGPGVPLRGTSGDGARIESNDGLLSLPSNEGRRGPGESGDVGVRGGGNDGFGPGEDENGPARGSNGGLPMLDII
jgi:hypothetical protein